MDRKGQRITYITINFIELLSFKIIYICKIVKCFNKIFITLIKYKNMK